MSEGEWTDRDLELGRDLLRVIREADEPLKVAELHERFLALGHTQDDLNRAQDYINYVLGGRTLSAPQPRTTDPAQVAAESILDIVRHLFRNDPDELSRLLEQFTEDEVRKVLIDVTDELIPEHLPEPVPSHEITRRVLDEMWKRADIEPGFRGSGEE